MICTVALLATFLVNDSVPTIQVDIGGGEIGTVEGETCFGCGDCSVYCVIEGEYHLHSSSHLEPQNGNRYEIKQLDDYNLQTAWIEGVDGYGEGEWFEFKFDKTDFSEIKIAVDGLYLFNGYRKSLEHWKDNSRVKKIKLVVNGQDYVVLNLADADRFQTANFGEIKIKKGTSIRFEIVEVYPGSKYKYVALSELKFTGVHHH